MGLSALVSRFRADPVPDEPPVVLQWAGSTKSYTFRREALRANFALPDLGDQPRTTQILSGLGWVLLPEPTEEDLNTLTHVLALLDDVIVRGLEDSVNWVLPKGFSETPWIQARLNRGYPVDEVVDILLDSVRVYMWLYRRCNFVNELIAQLLELDEAWVSLSNHLHPQEQEKSKFSREGIPIPPQTKEKGKS